MLNRVSKTRALHAMLLRAIGYLFVFFMVTQTSYTFQLQISIALGITHYLIASFFSKSLMWGMRKNFRGAFSFVVLVFVSLAFVKFGYSIEVLSTVFLFHHILSEAYVNSSYRFDDVRGGVGHLKHVSVARFFFEGATALALISFVPEINWIAPGWSLGLFVCSLAVYFFVLNFNKKLLRESQEFATICWIPAVNTGVVVTFYLSGAVHEFRMIDIVFYHFFVWSVQPILYTQEKIEDHPGGAFRYLFWTAAIFLLLLSAIYPLTPWKDDLWNQFFWLFMAYGYFHIFTSLALSRSNPRWLLRHFSSQL